MKHLKHKLRAVFMYNVTSSLMIKDAGSKALISLGLRPPKRPSLEEQRKREQRIAMEKQRVSDMR